MSSPEQDLLQQPPFHRGTNRDIGVSLPSSSALTARDRVLEEHSVPSPAHLPLRCRNSLPGSLTQIETDEVQHARLRTAAHDAWTWQTAPSAGMLALGTASGGLSAWSYNTQKPQFMVTAVAEFCISSSHELQICFSELFQPVLFLKNTNASNFVEKEQLTWLTQTWMDYWSSAELFFWDKNSSAGMKAFICQTLLQLKWRTCAISSWTHTYLHQPKEPSVQNLHMWALLICQHLWE